MFGYSRGPLPDRAELTLDRPLLLISIYKFQMPTFYDFSKTFRKSGSFRICFKTYRGFAPKQTIPFEITIVNEKKVKIRKIIVTLIQVK